MKVFLTLVAIALGALVMWFGFSSEEPRTPVVVIANAWHTASAVQSFQQQEADVYAPVVAQPASSVELSTRRLQSEKPCELSQAVEAFRSRRSKIWTAFEKKTNKPRLEQGLERLDWPKVEPTPKEKAAMIQDFQARIQKFDPENACLGPGNIHDDILGILSALEDVNVKASDLGEESFRKLAMLGQKEADEAIPNIQRFLDRGCFGTASYLMDDIHRIAKGLGDTTNMGYASLDEKITNAGAWDDAAWEQAGEDELLREALRIQYQQRARAIGCPGFG